MKKTLYTSLLAALVFPVIFSSCTNFLDSSSLKNELDNNISYSKKPYVTVNLDVNLDAAKSMTPAGGIYNDKYKAGDKIELNFEVKDTHKFIKWKAEPETAVKIEKADEQKTVATILNTSELITITPVCKKYVQVDYHYPTMESGQVDRHTTIRIKFDHRMDESSIYWNYKELDDFAKELGFTDDNPYYKDNHWYTKTEVDELTNKPYEIYLQFEDFGADTFPTQNSNEFNNNYNKNDDETIKDYKDRLYYYYVIYKKGKYSVYFRNISITNSDGVSSLCNYYDYPRFIDKTKTILEIPVVKDTKNESKRLPPYTTIKYEIEKFTPQNDDDFLGPKLTEYYQTNAVYDVSGPVVTTNGSNTKKLLNVMGYSAEHGEWNLIEGTITNPNADVFKKDLEALNKKGIYDTKTITIKDTISIQDDVTGFSYISLILTPVENIIYPDQDLNKVLELSAFAPQKVQFGTTEASSDTSLTFDLSQLEVEGLFKISLKAYDKAGNATTIIGGYYDPGYLILDNIFPKNKKITIRSGPDSSKIVTGPSDVYYIYMIVSAADFGSNKEQALLNFYYANKDKATLLTDENESVTLSRVITSSTYVRIEKYVLAVDRFGNYFYTDYAVYN